MLRIVTGKGGVGKTRTSLLLSRRYSDHQLWEFTTALPEEAKRLGIELGDIKRTTTQDLLESFLSQTVKFAPLVKLASQSKLLQNILNLAPNLDELLLFHHWWTLSRKKPLIVDGPSTGNLIGYFRCLETARDFFDSGSLRRMADDLHHICQEGKDIEVVIVSLPENSALEEMKEIQESILKIYPKIGVKTVLNRFHKKPKKDLPLSENLQALAYERPEREEKRLTGYTFDESIPEGGLTL